MSAVAYVVPLSDEELVADAITYQRAAEAAEAEAGSPHRWRQAERYWELNQRGWSMRQIASAVGVSKTVVNVYVRCASGYPDRERPLFWHAYAEVTGERGPATFEPRPVVAPEGTFATVVADPPWQYDNKATRGAAEDHYPTMSIEELCALPVKDWLAEQAHLYLWTTNGFLRESFDVLDAWGFTYKTTLVWVKPQIGMGNYFRSSAEYVLFGVKGGLRTRDCNQRNWFEAPRAKHSQKPGLFFDLVEKASYPPYLEMFARQRRLNPDWDYWGNEA